MNDATLTNPYRIVPSDDLALAPFAGRQAALAQLHARLADPANTEAMLYLGRKGVGKTAFLRHVYSALDETFIGVYIALDDSATTDEMEWLLTLARYATAELIGRGYPLGRLTELPPPLSDVRGWFVKTFVPELLSVIRAHRRMVFLLDDADVLLDALVAGRLPDDSFVFLRDVLNSTRQLEMVLTLAARREGEVGRMAPLISVQTAYRLSNLTPDETASLLQAPVAGLYRVPEPTVAVLHRATGGAPALLRMFGEALFRHWEDEPDVTTASVDQVRALIPLIYTRAEDVFQEIWNARAPNEQLTLTAISRLYYDNPLGKIDAEAIADWLVETEFPLDTTAINAAIRSLEYDEILTQGPTGVSINAGMMQTWLMDNTETPSAADTPEAAEPAARAPLRWVVLAIILLIAGVLALVSVSSTPRADTPPQAAPTVTLVDAG
jgi:hypothetical protein